jgi:hypothetical protein
MLSPGSMSGANCANFTSVSACLSSPFEVSSDDRSITDEARSYIRRTKLVWHYESTQDRGDVAVCGARPTRHPARRTNNLSSFTIRNTFQQMSELHLFG